MISIIIRLEVQASILKEEGRDTAASAINDAIAEIKQLQTKIHELNQDRYWLAQRAYPAGPSGY